MRGHRRGPKRFAPAKADEASEAWDASYGGSEQTVDSRQRAARDDKESLRQMLIITPGAVRNRDLPRGSYPAGECGDCGRGDAPGKPQYR